MEFFAAAAHHATQTISVSPPGGSFPTSEVRLLHATDYGHSALYVVWGIFTLGLVGVMVLALRVEKRARVFHWLSALVLATAMVSYLAMATGLGISYVPIHFHEKKAAGVHLLREVYYARYVDWLFTTPLLLVSLGILAGLSPADTLLAIVADVFMIVTGLLGGLVPARYTYGERARWAWFTVSCVFFSFIWYILVVGGLRAAKSRPKKTRGLFTLLAGMTLILWTAYPIVFGLTEGANILSVDTEIISYAVLDVAAKVGFTYLLLSLHSHGDEDTYHLPDWFTEHREGDASENRGRYGALGTRDE